MNYLIDTNVISELRKRRRTDAGVSSWFESVDEDALFLSVLVLGELRTGIERRRRKDPDAAAALNSWLRGIERDFSDRILPVDAAVAEEWGQMNGPRPLSCVDSLLAATARVHGLTLVTRNIKDIRSTGVEWLNPFENEE